MFIQRLWTAGGSQEKRERFSSQNQTISTLELLNPRILKTGSKLCTHATRQTTRHCSLPDPGPNNHRIHRAPVWAPTPASAPLTRSWGSGCTSTAFLVRAWGLVSKTPPCTATSDGTFRNPGRWWPPLLHRVGGQREVGTNSGRYCECTHILLNSAHLTPTLGLTDRPLEKSIVC